MSAENVEAVSQMFETFCRATWESGEWLSGYDRGVVYHPREDELDTRECVGREAWARIVAGFMDAFSEITFDVDDTHDGGDWAIVSTVLHGRGGASGVDVNDRYVFAYRMRDGLVVEGWEYHTMDAALAAVRERLSSPADTTG
ncbi:MAG TPA: nuclear transport factor 2 family protein [Solirubrobacteraceae bacterium]|jgi:ketosteroid isomerase-like protein|nr:nuclear transport factor 2 family protein [Solirubrobacteraceae bacterium]